MIHYVLASHGNYAREALNSAKMICGGGHRSDEPAVRTG